MAIPTSKVQWIRIASDIFDDEKVMFIEQLPEADSIIVIWFKLLCFAGKQNNDGIFLLNERIAYTDEMFSVVFRRPINTVRLALQTFERFGMIEIIKDTVTIPNWKKYQADAGLDVVREQTRIRVRAFRERSKQKALTSGEAAQISEKKEQKDDKKDSEEGDKEGKNEQCNVTCNATRNVTVTKCNIPPNPSPSTPFSPLSFSPPHPLFIIPPISPDNPNPYPLRRTNEPLERNTSAHAHAREERGFPQKVAKDELSEEQLDEEIEKFFTECELFLKAHPNVIDDLADLPQEEIDFQALSAEIEKSKNHLSHAVSITWLLRNYTEIMSGKYRDFTDKEAMEKQQETVKEQLIRAADARAERERWYAERKRAAEAKAEAMLAKARAIPTYAQAERALNALEIQEAKATIAKDEFELKEIAEKRAAAKKAIAMTLKQANINEEDLKPIYHCPKCSDTGYLPNGKACDCYRMPEIRPQKAVG